MLSPATALKPELGSVVSIVKVRLLADDILPVLSVCFTQTVLLPSPLGTVKLVPLPVAQVTWLSVLYCQLAASPAKPTFTTPLWVIKSEDEMPVSSPRVRVGAATVVSKMNSNSSDGLEVLPATSIWRTIIFFKPSVLSGIELSNQVPPPLVLYCHVAEPSIVRFSLLSLVLLSLEYIPLPVSLRKLFITGASTKVLSVKIKALLGSEMLPAISVKRTLAWYSWLSPTVKLLPVPACHVTPLLPLHSQVKPDSAMRGATFTVPELVMVSKLLLPVSLSSVGVFAIGFTVSTEMATPALRSDRLPASSVAIAVIVLIVFSARIMLLRLQSPLALVTTVPLDMPLLKTSTLDPASAFPVSVCIGVLVNDGKLPFTETKSGEVGATKSMV